MPRRTVSFPKLEDAPETKVRTCSANVFPPPNIPHTHNRKKKTAKGKKKRSVMSTALHNPHFIPNFENTMKSDALLYQKINELPANMRAEVLAFVDKLLQKVKDKKPKQAQPKKYREAGGMKGEIILYDSFFEPMDDEFLDYFG